MSLYVSLGRCLYVSLCIYIDSLACLVAFIPTYYSSNYKIWSCGDVVISLAAFPIFVSTYWMHIVTWLWGTHKADMCMTHCEKDEHLGRWLPCIFMVRKEVVASCSDETLVLWGRVGQIFCQKQPWSRGHCRVSEYLLATSVSSAHYNTFKMFFISQIKKWFMWK